MTGVEFHANVDDKLHYSCRLIRKAVRSGADAVVVGQADTLRQLDQLLWSYSNTEFLPHCFANSPEATRVASPVLLVEQLTEQLISPLTELASRSVLINLGQQVPVNFERFERLIEIASSQADDRQAALGRWKYYKDRGYALKRHEAPSVGAAAPS